MFDRRTHPRTLTLKTARISYLSDTTSIDCAILDVSEGGARILIPDGAEVPAEFTLTVDGTNASYLCDKVWSAGNRIGISFRTANTTTTESESRDLAFNLELEN